MLPEACIFLLPFSPAFDADSCDVDSLEFQDEMLAEENSRAVFSLSQTGGESWESRFRHRSRSDRWNESVEIRNGEFNRGGLEWRDRNWRVSVGDAEDSTMPLRPSWLPRRSRPGLRRAGVGAEAAGVRAYAARAWDDFHASGEPHWEPRWAFRHFAGGAELDFPLHLSLHASETRVSRGTGDSVSEHLAAAGVATPGGALAIDWAFGGRGENFAGAHAFGARIKIPFGKGGFGDAAFRRHGRGWSSIWDPAWMDPEAAPDSLSTSGAGEFVLRLRVPLPARVFAEGEGWRSWTGVATHRVGLRGRAWMSRPGWRVELRGGLGEYHYPGGTVRLDRSVAWKAAAGKEWRWECAWRRRWEGATQRDDASFAVEIARRRFHFRPGLKMEKHRNDSVRVSVSLGTRIPLAPGWDLEASASGPAGSTFRKAGEWKAALRYADVSPKGRRAKASRRGPCAGCR